MAGLGIKFGIAVFGDPADVHRVSIIRDDVVTVYECVGVLGRIIASHEMLQRAGGLIESVGTVIETPPGDDVEAAAVTVADEAVAGLTAKVEALTGLLSAAETAEAEAKSALAVAVASAQADAARVVALEAEIAARDAAVPAPAAPSVEPAPAEPAADPGVAA